jgi:hypothetical protein
MIFSFYFEIEMLTGQTWGRGGGGSTTNQDRNPIKAVEGKKGPRVKSGLLWLLNHNRIDTGVQEERGKELEMGQLIAATETLPQPSESGHWPLVSVVARVIFRQF